MKEPAISHGLCLNCYNEEMEKLGKPPRKIGPDYSDRKEWIVCANCKATIHDPRNYQNNPISDTLYALMHCVEYEGCRLVGVFDHPDTARVAISRAANKYHYNTYDLKIYPVPLNQLVYHYDLTELEIEDEYRDNPADTLEDKIRKLCLFSDLSPEEISHYMDIPIGWAETACSTYRRDHPYVANPGRELEHRLPVGGSRDYGYSNIDISIGPGWEKDDWMLDIYGSPDEGLRLFFDDLGQLQDFSGRLSRQIEAMVKELYGL